MAALPFSVSIDAVGVSGGPGVGGCEFGGVAVPDAVAEFGAVAGLIPRTPRDPVVTFTPEFGPVC